MGIVLALEDIPRAIFMLLGAGNGYIAIMLFTWMQTRMPKEMLGRMMSMLILSGMGLVPISQAISGAVRKWSLTNLFVIAGGLNLLIPTWAVFQPGSEALKSRLAAEN